MLHVPEKGRMNFGEPHLNPFSINNLIRQDGHIIVTIL
jgi:hypothetical protein